MGSISEFLSFYSDKWKGPKYRTSRKNGGHNSVWINAKSDVLAVFHLLRDERVLDLGRASLCLKLNEPENFAEHVNYLSEKNFIRIESWNYNGLTEERTPVAKYDPSLQSFSLRFLAFLN